MLQAWDSVYFMIGSAAAGLIGLLFVVVTLTSTVDRVLALRATRIYVTPTVMNFAFVFAMSAVALAPGLPRLAAATAFGLTALVGLASAVRACIGISKGMPGGEPPHWTDFWFYGAAPAATLGLLVAASVGIGMGAAWAVYAAPGFLLILLLIGIRNAWDLVTWMAPGRGAGGG